MFSTLHALLANQHFSWSYETLRKIMFDKYSSISIYLLKFEVSLPPTVHLAPRSQTRGRSVLGTWVRYTEWPGHPPASWETTRGPHRLAGVVDSISILFQYSGPHVDKVFFRSNVRVFIHSSTFGSSSSSSSVLLQSGAFWALPNPLLISWY